jgi:hypothetical protein
MSSKELYLLMVEIGALLEALAVENIPSTHPIYQYAVKRMEAIKSKIEAHDPGAYIRTAQKFDKEFGFEYLKEK